MGVPDFINANFGWTGGLYSNLIASALLGTGAFFWGKAFEQRAIGRHNQQLEQKRRHHEEQMAKLNAIHKDVKGKSNGR